MGSRKPENAVQRKQVFSREREERERSEGGERTGRAAAKTQ